MIALETIREKLGTAEPWVESRGTYWLNPGAASVRDVALAMNAAGARFVTITAYELPGDEGFRLEYHWDLEGACSAFRFKSPAILRERQDREHLRPVRGRGLDRARGARGLRHRLHGPRV